MLDSCINPSSIDPPAGGPYVYEYIISDTAISIDTMIAQPGGARCAINYSYQIIGVDVATQTRLSAGFSGTNPVSFEYSADHDVGTYQV